jgi:putative ABC transport system substrate-binding protein
MVTTTIINRSLIAVLLLAIAAFHAITPISAISAGTGKIVVVKSAELKPYQDVVRGLQDRCGCEVKEVKFKGEEDKKNILDGHPEAIVAIGTAAFKKVMAIKDLPVIYTMVMPSETTPPLRANISGVSIDISPQTYLSTMTDLFTKADRIGLVYDPRNTAEFVESAIAAAGSAGIELVTKKVNDPSQIPAVLKEMQQKIDILWLIPDPTVVTNEMVDYMFRFSFQNNIPIFTFSKKYVEMGAVASLDIDPYDMGRQVASIINKVLAGQSIGSTVYARKSHLTVNRKMATKLGINIREGLLTEVDKIE